MKKIGQKGFTLVESLLIVIALSLVVGIGYYVYNANRETGPTSSPSSTTENKPVKAEKSEKQFLAIKELGIKFELTDKLKNAYYKFGSNGEVYLSVHEIDSMMGFKGCVAGPESGQDGIAAVSYAKAGDDNFGSPWTEKDLNNIAQVKIGETHYWIEPRSQAPCYDVDSVKETDPNIGKLGSYKKEMVKQGVTITKL